MPLVSPVTRMGELEPVALPAAPPLDDVHAALWLLIAAPPFCGIVSGVAVKDTLIWALPPVAVPIPGAAGTTGFTVKLRCTCAAAL